MRADAEVIKPGASSLTKTSVQLRRSVVFAIAAAIVLLGGCTNMLDHNALKGLDDIQTRAQVMDPLKEIVRALKLNPLSGTFGYDACDQSSDPVFRGGSGGTFEPIGVSADDLKKQVVDTMIAQGWASGAGPGKLVYGTTLHLGEVFAVVSISDKTNVNPDKPGIEIYGTCDNRGDHNGSPGTTDIVDELKSTWNG